MNPSKLRLTYRGAWGGRHCVNLRQKNWSEYNLEQCGLHLQYIYAYSHPKMGPVAAMSFYTLFFFVHFLVLLSEKDQNRD